MTIAIALVITSFSTAAMQGEKNVKHKIHVDVKSSHDRVHPGSHSLTLLIVDIQDGWHINSAAPLDENFIPTSVEVKDTTTIRHVEVHYPQGREVLLDFSDAPLDVYEGSIRILLSYCTATDLEPGTYSIPVTIHYQACNDNICLAPDSLVVEVPVDVVSQTEPVREINPELFHGYGDLPER